MKIVKYIVVIAALLVTITSCYKEDPITAKDLVDGNGRFTFPEGSNPWDQRLDSIYKAMDVQSIYKSFTDADLNKQWSGFNITKTGETLNDSLPALYTNFMVDNFFYYLNPVIAKQVLPMYIYFVDNYASAGQMPDYSITSSNTGMDNWIITFHNLYMESGQTKSEVQRLSEQDPVLIKQRQDQLFYWYINAAIERGIVTEPDGFRDGMDYKTAVSSSSRSANYYLSRGFCDKIVSVISWDGITRNSNIHALAGAPSSAGNDFQCYVQMALYFTKAEFEAHYAKYPTIINRYNLVVSHLLNDYKIDLQKMAASER